MIEIILRIVIIFTCIMVAGCGIVFFFLIKRAKATYCENEEQAWEVVERKYLRKRNRVILLYTFVLIIFYLFVFFWMKEKGISFANEEKIFFLMYFLIFFPITFHIELNYRNMERWEIEEQNLSKLKGINYLLERRSIQKGRSFSFLFAFIIVVGIFLITEEDFLFTGPSNKTKGLFNFFFCYNYSFNFFVVLLNCKFFIHLIFVL